MKSIYPTKESLSTISEGLTKRILLTCFVLVFIGGLNSLWTNLDYNSWHDTLNRPFFAPNPDWIVAIFWGVVYSLLGISIALLMQIRNKNHTTEIQTLTKKGLWLFFVQMLVNLTISALFFGLNNLFLVFIGAFLNLILVVWMMFFYFRISKHASLILIPYAAWLIYAILLDFTILMIN